MIPDPDAAAAEGWPRAVLAASLVAVCLAVASAWWLASDEADEPAVIDAAPPATLFPTSFADVEKPSISGAQDAPVAAVGADDEIQLCGGHWVKAGVDGKPMAKEFVAVVTAEQEEVTSSVLTRMLASTSPRTEAAAHYYHAVNFGPWYRSAEAAAHGDALVRVAQTNADAQIYAWAYRYCNAGAAETPGSCLQLSAAQWARMDPENADPWLAVAEEARRRGDFAALDDAMFRVAAAERHDSSRAMFAATLAEFAPQDERSLLGAYEVITHAAVIESVQWPSWKETAEYCGAKAIADPNRRETCERVATVLVDRSTTAIARTTGLDIGKRLDWDAGRLGAIAEREEVEAAASRLSSPHIGPDFTDCASMRTVIERVRATAEFGQIGMLRRQASSYTVAQLAGEVRRQREREARELAAEQAASGAVAASMPSGETFARR